MAINQTVSDQNHVLELLPEYTLGCLEPEEARRVARHLKDCSLCRTELQAYEHVTGQLALSVPQVEPPRALKARLFQQIQVEDTDPADASQSTWWQQLQQFWQRIGPVWGVASLILILALAAGNMILWQQVTEPDTSPMQVVTLTGTEAAPGAVGTIVISLDGEHGTLVVDNLPALDPAYQYQLWLIKDGQRTDGGVFSVNRDGYGALWVDSPAPLASYSAFGVTVEPAGGSPGPTGDRVLRDSL